MADEKTKSEAAPKAENAPIAAPPVAPATTTGGGRKAVGALLSILIIVGAIALAFYVWSVNEQHPRTDDAVARANVIGIVPRVQGPIVKLHVVENQAVKAGDPLFEIDPEDYELAVEKAKANVAALDKEIEVARVQDQELAFTVKVMEAGVERAKAQLKQTQDTLDRTEPLLKQRFTTAEQVDQARTARNVAATAVETEQQRLNQAKVAVSKFDTLTAQRLGLVATLKLAELELSYCKVNAPFPGRVISLNISEGAHVSPLLPVFSLLDTRQWYVIANFREAEIQRIAPGQQVEVYLLSAPRQRFRGKVQGIGWAVQPEGEIELRGMPYVKRELNWVHIAQRFPVRIAIEDPDAELFRMGASAVAIIRGQPAK
ncbi:MAG: rane fusion protein multidrug efflux system [Chthoniobacter sp.]|jgi:multidrug efflux system membrane fusion protein|nr:rane fusion protein multidrug efflux system [Chthoniobacter sp.]